MSDRTKITTESQAAQVESGSRESAGAQNPHLAAPWKVEPFTGIGAWGDRYTVRTAMGQSIALDIPKEIAEFIVEWVNIGIEAVRPLTPEEREDALRTAGDDEFRAEAEAKEIERRYEEDEDNRTVAEAEADADAEHRARYEAEQEANAQAADQSEEPVF